MTGGMGRNIHLNSPTYVTSTIYSFEIAHKYKLEKKAITYNYVFSSLNLDSAVITNTIMNYKTSMKPESNSSLSLSPSGFCPMKA